MPVPQIKEVPVMKQETVEGMREMPEIMSCRTRWKASRRVNQCSSGPPSRVRMCLNSGRDNRSGRERVQQPTIEEIFEVGRLVLQERVQQRGAEQTEDLRQSQEETVEMVRSVAHERVQQRAAEQVEDAPQFRKRPSRR